MTETADILEGTPLAALDNEFSTVRARIEEGRKTPEKCAGVSRFTEGDWDMLTAIEHGEFQR